VFGEYARAAAGEADTMQPREDGFYRVIYRGQWIVAEYTYRGRVCGEVGEEKPPWCLPGVPGWVPTRDLSVIGGRVGLNGQGSPKQEGDERD